MSGDRLAPGESTTTADPPRGLLLRVFADGDGIMVKDTTGLRYGWGLTLGEAIQMWADCVQDCLDETNAGGPYLLEQRAYRAALARLDNGAAEREFDKIAREIDRSIASLMPANLCDYCGDRRLVSGMGETVRCPRCAVSPADTTEGTG